MTTVAPRAPQRSTAPPARRRPARNHSATRRTLLALLAAALGIVPLKGLFSDTSWLIDVWISMLVVVGPAALVRLRRPPGALDIWPGIVLLVPWLTVRFLHDSAAGGFIPTGTTITRLSQLMSDLHETTREEVAPIHTTVPVRLVLCALVGLLAALVDLIAVVGRRGALAGVPLLIVFTVSGAVPRSPVAWYLFGFAAIGFLLLLALDAGDDLSQWGRRVHASADTRGAPVARTALAVSTPRIAAAAVVVAVLLPLLVPGQPRNLLANAFHGGGSGESGGSGGDGGSISPFADLRGDLQRKTPRKLADVQMTKQGSTPPFYLKVNTLTSFSARGWSATSHGPTTAIDGNQFPLPAGGSPDTVGLEARISISGMRGVPPVFSNPTQIDGLDPSTTWSAQDGVLQSSSVGDGLQFTEQFEQPDPTVQQLLAAPSSVDQSVQSQLAVPPTLSTFVLNKVAEIVSGVQGQYAKARAISDFFADPANGFSYSLSTETGDSDDDLVNFLNLRVGFCQQYAAAMAIMLRVAGVPARVALGYLHSPPDRNGKFSVSTSNAHSWVEAWFAGIGWIPFDPTPSSGLGGAGSNLAWEPQDNPSQQPSTSTSPSNSASSSAARPSSSAASSSAAPTPQADSSSGSVPLFGWVAGGGLVVVLLALVPAGLRWSRRRQRYAAARRDGDADVLWDELTDTAVDLGYVWSASRSPRQVATWLGADAPRSADSLQALAAAVEQRRYAASGGPGTAPAAPPADMVGVLRGVTDELRHTRGGRVRLRARFWPASLGWTTRLRDQPRRRL